MDGSTASESPAWSRDPQVLQLSDIRARHQEIFSLLRTKPALQGNVDGTVDYSLTQEIDSWVSGQGRRFQQRSIHPETESGLLIKLQDSLCAESCPEKHQTVTSPNHPFGLRLYNESLARALVSVD